MKDELIAISNLSERYWNGICKLKAKKDIDNINAIYIFLENYAYERQGAPEKYKTIAIETISYMYSNNYINNSNARNIAYKKYVSLLKSHNTKENKRNNLFLIDGYNIIDLVKEVKNIQIWAKNKIESGNILKAHQNLMDVRGIGKKIASFYLRDIAKVYDIEHYAKKNSELLHPIDIWTRRGWSAWKSKCNIDEKTPEKGLAKICDIIGVSHGDINSGLWFYGAVICKNKDIFKKSLQSRRYIDNIVEIYDS